MTLPQGADPVKFIDAALIDHLKKAAAASPRRRMNFNFHQSMDEGTHRFLNVMLHGSYLCPHRHFTPPKSETFLILEGRLALFLFDDSGNIRDCRLIGPETPVYGVDIGPQVWHSMVVLTEHIVCFETKPGPYDPAVPSEFAPWAPREGDPASSAYMQKLSDYAARLYP